MRHDSHQIHIDAVHHTKGPYGSYTSVHVWYIDSHKRTRTLFLVNRLTVEQAQDRCPNALTRYILCNEETGHNRHVGKEEWQKAIQ